MARKAEEVAKGMLWPSVIFEELGLKYYGPIDGHDTATLIKTFEFLKKQDRPVLLHVLTQKGKGFEPAMQKQKKFHGLGPYDPETGETKPLGRRTYSEVFADTLVKLADSDPKVVAITAAMPNGTGLDRFQPHHPDKYFDVGIAEEHAVLFAAGLAVKGYKPFCAIYSTFLQRAFDPIVHDVCLQNLPVVFCMDRGSLSADDGPTHHGLFDISYLRSIPNLVHMVPKDEDELADMLFTAKQWNGPIAVRYPRGLGPGTPVKDVPRAIPIGKAELLQHGESRSRRHLRPGRAGAHGGRNRAQARRRRYLRRGRQRALHQACRCGDARILRAFGGSHRHARRPCPARWLRQRRAGGVEHAGARHPGGAHRLARSVHRARQTRSAAREVRHHARSGARETAAAAQNSSETAGITKPVTHRLAAFLCLAAAPCGAQDWDLPARLRAELSGATGKQLTLTFEQRGRYESRTGTTFGRDPDVATGLFRTRLGLTYTPAPWLKFSGMAQDSRAPWYGSGAPNSVRDPLDWHEGYIELFPARKRGFGMTAGRMMLNYGEGRLIGTPQWGNLSRTYDQARIYWRSPRVRLEFLGVSVVKVRIGEFNRPVLGDRVWGTYNSFPDFYKSHLLEVYALRHDQNRPGGFTGGSARDGTDKIAIDTFGFRLTGPLARGLKYSVEAALQRGKVGPADHAAEAWFAGLSRQWDLAGYALNTGAEYKFASGTANPADPRRTTTFDQLYPANHDKFGHEDLFGWRNLHNARSLTTFAITKSLALNFLYDSFWLANVKDGLYNSAGRQVARAAAGNAGRHVGQETDLFATYKRGHFTLGAGYGHFFSGTFIRNATPGVGPTYLYVFHTYTL